MSGLRVRGLRIGAASAVALALAAAGLALAPYEDEKAYEGRVIHSARLIAALRVKTDGKI